MVVLICLSPVTAAQNSLTSLVARGLFSVGGIFKGNEVGSDGSGGCSVDEVSRHRNDGEMQVRIDAMKIQNQ